jgi:predicted NUDIX family NTP pyrophosphohydrolase
MTKYSAGILAFRINNGKVEVLLAHHGGPYWANKDSGAWSIIKGETEEGEDPFTAAKREFKEETSHDAPDGEYLDLGEITIKSGKTIHVWAIEADYDPKTIISNNFEMEWPPKSGKMQEFPENDRAEWFSIGEVGQKLNTGQDIFIDRLKEKLHIKTHRSDEQNQQKLL